MFHFKTILKIIFKYFKLLEKEPPPLFLMFTPKERYWLFSCCPVTCFGHDALLFYDVFGRNTQTESILLQIYNYPPTNLQEFSHSQINYHIMVKEFSRPFIYP